MPFKINPKRNFTFKHTVGEDSFEVDFSFRRTEEPRPKDLLDKLAGVKDTDGLTDDMSHFIFFSTLRSALKAQRGIIDETTDKELELVKEDGSINEENQKAIFDFCITLDTLREDIITAYNGFMGKN